MSVCAPGACVAGCGQLLQICIETIDVRHTHNHSNSEFASSYGVPNIVSHLQLNMLLIDVRACARVGARVRAHDGVSDRTGFRVNDERHNMESYIFLQSYYSHTIRNQHNQSKSRSNARRVLPNHPYIIQRANEHHNDVNAAPQQQRIGGEQPQWRRRRQSIN